MILKEKSPNEEPHAIYPIRWMSVGNLDNVPVPLVRITTCGSLKIEVLYTLDSRSSLGYYRAVSLESCPKGSSTGLVLLKILTSLPGHYASKDWLIEHLSRTRNHENDDEEGWGRGLVRVDNVVYLLRHLLCSRGIIEAEKIRKMLVSYVRNHRESGPGYLLAGEPFLWLDIDIIASLFNRAVSLEQQGQDAFACWEQVYLLASKGIYLADEPYSDWAKDKRLEIEGYLRHSVNMLHRLYLSSGRDDREELVIMLLRQYWQAHPTDEGVLRPLMELLSKNARVQEALDCYQRLCERLAMEEGAPDEQTLKIAQNLRPNQGQHNPASLRRKEIGSSVHQWNEPFVPFSSSATQRIIENVPNIDSVKLGFMQKNNCVVNEVTFSLSKDLPQEPLWQRISKTLDGPSKIDEAALIQLQKISNSYWELRTTLGYRDILNALMGHLETVHELLKCPQSTGVFQQLCSIASQNAQFIGAIYFDMSDHANALAYYKVSIAAAKEAKNSTLWSTGLGRMSSLPIYDNNPRDALPLLRQALKLANESRSANLIAWLYALQAEAFSYLQEKQECLQALKKAEQSVERMHQGNKDELKFDHTRLVGYRGTCYLRLRQPKTALTALEGIATLPVHLSPRQQSIVLTDMAAAYIQKKEIEEACACATKALEINDRIKSRLVLTRLHTISHDLAPWKSLGFVQDFEEKRVSH